MFCIIKKQDFCVFFSFKKSGISCFCVVLTKKQNFCLLSYTKKHKFLVFFTFLKTFFPYKKNLDFSVVSCFIQSIFFLLSQTSKKLYFFVMHNEVLVRHEPFHVVSSADLVCLQVHISQNAVQWTLNTIFPRSAPVSQCRLFLWEQVKVRWRCRWKSSSISSTWCGS